MADQTALASTALTALLVIGIGVLRVVTLATGHDGDAVLTTAFTGCVTAFVASSAWLHGRMA